jgi:hypothetical protein
MQAQSWSPVKHQPTIGVSTLAIAILDRLVHTADRIEISGEILCKKRTPDIVV